MPLNLNITSYIRKEVEHFLENAGCYYYTDPILAVLHPKVITMHVYKEDEEPEAFKNFLKKNGFKIVTIDTQTEQTLFMYNVVSIIVIDNYDMFDKMEKEAEQIAGIDYKHVIRNIINNNILINNTPRSPTENNIRNQLKKLLKNSK